MEGGLLERVLRWLKRSGSVRTLAENGGAVERVLRKWTIALLVVVGFSSAAEFRAMGTG